MPWSAEVRLERMAAVAVVGHGQVTRGSLRGWYRTEDQRAERLCGERGQIPIALAATATAETSPSAARPSKTGSASSLAPNLSLCRPFEWCHITGELTPYAIMQSTTHHLSGDCVKVTRLFVQ